MEKRPGVALYAPGGRMVPFSDTGEFPRAVKMLPDGNGEQGHHDEAHLWRLILEFSSYEA